MNVNSENSSRDGISLDSVVTDKGHYEVVSDDDSIPVDKLRWLPLDNNCRGLNINLNISRTS